jgi:hypothetical protein
MATTADAAANVRPNCLQAIGAAVKEKRATEATGSGMAALLAR